MTTEPQLPSVASVSCRRRNPESAISGRVGLAFMSWYTDGWDHYLNRIRETSDGPETRDRLTDAVQTLRRNLGENWPLESKDSHHPILWELRLISGAVADGLLVIWGDSMSAVEGSKGFDGMLAKLRRRRGLESAIAELETAGRLASRGCRVEFEPETGLKKRPDLRCQCGKSEFLVEVKTLGAAPETSRATQTGVDILAACRSINPVGAIFKTLSKPHSEEVAGILAREAGRAISGNIAVEVDLDKVLKLYLVPDALPGSRRIREEWRRRHERTGALPRSSGWLSGPPHGVREEHRVRRRIGQFAGECQIPPEETGALFLTGPFLFQGADDAERFVDCIIEEIYQIRNVPAVVLVSGKTLGGHEETAITETQDFTFIRNKVYDMIHEDVVIVKNRFCESRFDHENLKHMLAAKT